ncbi:MAG: ATPase, T2SS/T4P/T4SS family, partial [Syntrophorhabdaceae bacterium]|nr:ATPase, T2SS/T4P/T4SS family [Syntrophorhabdaceae bacterium]
MKTEILQKALKEGISKGVKSIFFFPEFPPLGNKKGIEKLGSRILSNKDIDDILKITLTGWQRERFEREKEIDYSFEVIKGIRFRFAAFYRMGQVSIVARPIPVNIPSFEMLGIPSVIKDFTELKQGIVFITGPAGSGKSTTIASIIDIINQKKALHIVTVEDPIEFV